MLKRKTWMKIVLLLVIAILIEICIFNFRSIQSLFYTEHELTGYDFSDETQLVKGNTYKVTTNGVKYIELLNINEEVKNIHLNIEYYDEDDIFQPLDITLSATDAAHELYFTLPERTMINSTPKSQYMTLDLSGKSEKLKIRLDVEKGNTIVINSISINSHIPMYFSIERVLILFFGMLIVYILRPSSVIYKYKCKENSTYQILIVTGLILVQVVFFAFLVNSNPQFVSPVWKHHQQYQMLAHSISEGHVYLDEDPPSALAAMDNPYDRESRIKVLKEADQSYIWDAAYYNGKYYVYFGIVPELVFYLPYYLIFHEDFSTYMGIFITGVFFIIAVYGLISQIIKRWFKNTPFAVYAVISTIFINCCGILYLMARPDFYSLPIIMGVTFSLLGLYFWMSYLNKTRGIKLLAGSLCMALVAGCRPTLLIGSFLAVPLFWNTIFKERRLFSRKNIKDTLCFCIPYIIIAAGIMYYNGIRFSSVFDFGANYNLTTNDMTNRGFKLDRIPLGIYMYLFQLPVITADFPFIKAASFTTNYLGMTIYENMFGGLVAGNIFLYAGFFIRTVKNKLKEKEAWLFTCLCGIFTVVLVIADTQIAGILYRYVSDFGWLVFLFATMIMLALYEKAYHRKLEKYLIYFLIISMIVGLLYSTLLNFTTTANLNTIYKTYPELFYKLKYFIQFWL